MELGGGEGENSKTGAYLLSIGTVFLSVPSRGSKDREQILVGK